MPLNVTLLRANFELVATREPEVAQRFYNLLFTRYPQLTPLFGRSSQEAQGRMLTDMLVAVLDHLEDEAWLTTNLKALGTRHEAYGVTAEMYPMVGECLLDSLEAVSGDTWSAEMELAWSEAYGAIAGLMQAPLTKGERGARMPGNQADAMPMA